MTPEVIHYEDEKLVGLVLDYELAGKLLRILGRVHNRDGFLTIYNELVEMREVKDAREQWEPFSEILEFKKAGV